MTTSMKTTVALPTHFFLGLAASNVSTGVVSPASKSGGPEAMVASASGGGGATLARVGSGGGEAMGRTGAGCANVGSSGSATTAISISSSFFRAKTIRTVLLRMMMSPSFSQPGSLVIG
jgi:hypothetical protein